MHLAGDQLARRFRHGRHQLDLRQIGPRVLAVAQLHQAVIGSRVVAAARRTVEPDALAAQIEDHGAEPPQPLLDRRPSLRIGEALQESAQPVVVELPRGRTSQPNNDFSTRRFLSAQLSTADLR